MLSNCLVVFRGKEEEEDESLDHDHPTPTAPRPLFHSSFYSTLASLSQLPLAVVSRLLGIPSNGRDINRTSQRQHVSISWDKIAPSTYTEKTGVGYDRNVGSRSQAERLYISEAIPNPDGFSHGLSMIVYGKVLFTYSMVALVYFCQIWLFSFFFPHCIACERIQKQSTCMTTKRWTMTKAVPVAPAEAKMAFGSKRFIFLNFPHLEAGSDGSRLRPFCFCFFKKAVVSVWFGRD